MSLSVSTGVAYVFPFVSFVNSCPFLLSPITYIPCGFPFSSFCLDMYVVSPAAVMCFAFDMFWICVFPSSVVICSFTCCIFVVCDVVPSPSCPYPLYPTLHTVLSSFINTVWSLPDAISLTPYNTLPSVSSICVGNTFSDCVVPVPNCPLLLYPVLHILPSASSIDICSSPAVIWIMFDTFCIFTGYVFAFPLAVLFPNCP